MPPRVFASAEEACAAAAAEIVGLLRESKRPSLALSGGRAGTAVMKALAEKYVAGLDWKNVDFFWADERRVPLDHPRSNYGLARKILLDPLGVSKDKRHPLETTGPAPTGLTVVLLGLGEDGHTASLFPGSPALNIRESRIVETRAPDGEARLTLTLPCLNIAEERLVVAFGAGKAEPVAAALAGQGPAGALRVPRWFLDRACAKELKS